MPKLKTHSGTKDRVSITKTGKVMARKSFGHHFLEKKRAARKRTLAGKKELSPSVVGSIKKKLGV
ncbi:MAG: large subunit ribosomal protein [Patescibacteria group bacterium]|nr:large subunit ribosomal protein [Patescibacteria group bacterium]MDQ5953907.1 large subunit ribosomal protein [Patescibacteria group bacterium]MDQ5958846.1 large subunit ribosomal protein [Patescibacteria group bacterium]